MYEKKKTSIVNNRYIQTSCTDGNFPNNMNKEFNHWCFIEHYFLLFIDPGSTDVRDGERHVYHRTLRV
jgi:hypothetical protein